ncbi:MAG: ATP synthase F1 subunit epsilon [Saprospiraceae bacterium]|jgi:F-type H+-transporting ATPase subunit epsilon|nr:ATP synthase F1 subunit epsilon [Saprospiraceae bacterium]MDP4997995.1 ATP synthase F1 subunit epsilon [Saprospiraceae bacterium]
MNIAVLTPDNSIYTGQVQSVKVPGAAGAFTVLKRHIPIVSSLVKGKVTLGLEGGKQITFSIEKGFIEVNNNEISLLVQGVSDLQQ